MNKPDDSFEGEWWQAANPELRIGGILELCDKFELRLWGTIGDKGFPPLKAGFDSQIFHGQSLGNSLTLFDGHLPSTRVSSGGGSVVLFRIPLAFIGSYWLDDKEEAKFDRVCANIDNLVEWSNQRRMVGRHPTGKTVLEYTRPDPAVATIDGTTITLSEGLATRERIYSAQWDVEANLNLELATPEDVHEIDYKYIRPFRYLLNLATGSASAAGRLRVANPAHLDDPSLRWLDTYVYGRNRPVAKAIEPSLSANMLFTLQDIDFAKVVPRWYQLVEQLGIACDLLFSINAPENIFVGNQMFNVASAAEGIHQRLYPEADKKSPEYKRRLNEILSAVPEAHSSWLKASLQSSHRLTFAQRLDQLIDRAGSAVHPFVGDRAKWIKCVKDIRNQIAHALRERYSFETDVVKLAWLTATVDVLLRIVLLRELGFSDAECVTMADKNRQWTHLKRILPAEVPEIF